MELKHNLNNGENNRDGSDSNISWNCGVEGFSNNTKINNLRKKQMRNFAAILLLSQGVPMLLAGDEFARTQEGNNNPYCQDNEISWLNWILKDKNADLFRFFRLLVEFRKNQPALHRTRFEVENIDGRPEMSWHGFKLDKPDWSDNSKSLALLYSAKQHHNDIFIILNMASKNHLFQLPVPQQTTKWLRKLDTSLSSPGDICESGSEKKLADQNRYNVSARSIAVLISK